MIECELDGGTWFSCTSPFAPHALADGPHTLRVHQRDGAGNAGTPAVHEWTLDRTAPAAPAITEGPAGDTTATSATFKFAGEPGGSFECRFDTGAWTACTSPAAYDGLALGAHEFEVRQIDVVGNIGAGRRQAFTVVVAETPKPDAPNSETPTSAVTTTVAATATVTQQNRIAVGCRLDGGELASCTVVAYATVRAEDGRTRRVRIGSGRVTGASGQASREVLVSLNARGRRMLAASLGGLRVVFRTTASAVGTTDPLRSTAKARVFGSGTFVVPNDGLFASGSAALTREGVRFVRSLRSQMRRVRTITCTGHTDSINGAARNERLGARRARAVCRALVRGPALSGARTVIRSAGERRPRASNATAEGRARNRRVELARTCP